jgi:hypothetical protein
MDADSMRDSRPSALLIAGDVTVDWLLAVPTVDRPPDLQAAYQWELEGEAGLSVQPGGAALISQLARAVLGDSVDVVGPLVPDDVLANPGDDRLPRTFSVWRPVPLAVGRRELVWRMDQFHGVRTGSEIGLGARQSQAVPACIALNDAGLGFRDQADQWPKALSNEGFDGQIVLKMANPIAQGPLWEQLTAMHADRLTVCIASGDFRKSDAAIGQPLSWERLASEVAGAVRSHASLGKAARIVISLGHAGAVLIERDGPATIVFDPLHQEDDWERERPNAMLGLGTTLTVALAAETICNAPSPDWVESLAHGLSAARAGHEAGYQATGPDSGAIAFPIDVTALRLKADPLPDNTFSTAVVSEDPDWQLLPVADEGSYLDLAWEIVLVGDRSACQGVPVERMGAWTSIDRTEIESVRSLRNIIRQYLSQSVKSRPLSVAVFGPPGSGKSFAVKQMAKEWMASGTRIEVLEMNVAQFGSPADLATALQRVRDAAVVQTLPLVFWDEFDSPHDGKELGWLARFLAPMQDGLFLDGGIARPIGPAIFIFAGGTHATLASFKERSVTIPGAKASDFLSRLRGHVDVLGPNPRDQRDKGYVLRRALLLRSQLIARNPQLLRGGRLNIDPGVLRAFLEVPAYVHGARSLEAIIEMSSITGRLRYERSSLPARHQLALHVDPDAFLALVYADPMATG